MRKIISFMHISLDGYVAGPNGEMDWIKVDQDIFDEVGKRINKTDTALYGRVTYQMMESYWPTAADKPNATKHDVEHSKWYNKSHKVVISNTLNETNLQKGHLGLINTIIIGSNLISQIHELKQSKSGASQEILLFGSPKATHSLMQHGLIDGFWLFVNPIILGHGIPLFVDIKDKIKLNLLMSKSYKCGVTELNYTVD